MYIFREQPVPNRAKAVVVSGGHACESGCVGIWVGTTGNLVAILQGDSASVTFTAIPDGTWLPGHFKTVVESGTTASNMVEMYLDVNP